MEEAMKSLQIQPKVLARRSNAMSNILLACKEDAKYLTGSVRTIKSVRMQTVYMSTRTIRVRIHSVAMDFTEE